MNEYNCHVEPLEKDFDRQAAERAMVVYLQVGGMGCTNCAMRVQNGLLGLEGVHAAVVELERGLAAAAYDPEVILPSDLIEAVEQAGKDGRHNYWGQVLQIEPMWSHNQQEDTDEDRSTEKHRTSWKYDR